MGVLKPTDMAFFLALKELCEKHEVRLELGHIPNGDRNLDRQFHITAFHGGMNYGGFNVFKWAVNKGDGHGGTESYIQQSEDDPRLYF